MPYGRIHRVLLAFISLDFKAARPFAGLLDVGSHCYCFTCKTWHRAYLNSTNYKDWEAVDDDFLREGAEKWRDAQNKAERMAIEEQYGVRYSQFWRLPYWRPSKQVTTDPMHTGYQLTQPKEAISWTPVDSPIVLERIQQAVREVIVPGWIAKPSDLIGLPRGGTPKADNWRTLFSIFLPLALLSLWQEASPIAAEDADAMASVLQTSMYLTCAANKMSKHTLSLQDREDFREYLRLHIEGLKKNFPGFIQPSHHLAFHIYDDMDLFSVVHHFWCFPGERLIGFLKRIPINHKIGMNSFLSLLLFR
ncbi:uncharacterized protein C8R40DRAFT_1051744 [Lentinula edodes]|uniref:uncharacterized protein n=1 Tax=Lentinula edodes TaxID=5353 RepID=UPI001E8DA9F9|nr:uncharacterized protein C8R40DRAFT_1051744 [Lentinula edodes]KAH7872790.1 hypothetical protein C8R40DRAFT_1051744 [Lentinula edodes]